MLFIKVHIQFQIRTRIRNLELRIRILADPDPQHWFKGCYAFYCFDLSYVICFHAVPG
jgi:hypothetical protein